MPASRVLRMHRLRYFAVFGLVVFFSLRLAMGQTAQSAAPGGTNFITFLEGSVEVLKAGQTTWIQARQQQVLSVGDRLRTGERSRVQVYLASGKTTAINEFSEILIPAGPGLSATRGIMRVFSRDPQPGANFDTPRGIAALRGTDFLLRVLDDRTEVVVFDGWVELSNDRGKADVFTGQSGVAIPGQTPSTAKVDLQNPDFAQWSFYYPGVLNLRELTLPDEIKSSTAAYLAGDLPQAFELYDWKRTQLTPDETAYRANLLLSFGQLSETIKLSESLPAGHPLKRTIDLMLLAVQGGELPEVPEPENSSGMLALSYYYQSRGQLENALKWAEAARTDPEFAFAHARAADLQFSFGRTEKALRDINLALSLAPRNAYATAIKGFLLSARGEYDMAYALFNEAIALDGALANAWLGRGLIQFRWREDETGLRDLLVAASLEPRRSILRSYLAKAFQQRRDLKHSLHELILARESDRKDPTPWLYAALIQHLTNRINDAIRSLEHAQTLNTNRSVFRSAFLLDQDKAVRSANLAALYQDAGMPEVSLAEATRAVQSDYGNFSAHLFLANSYNNLRDPTFGDLRFETVTFSEYLVANLLAPPGAARLSPQVSQQEYSRLFERNRLGFSYAGSYLSDGEWSHAAVQYGNIERSSYAVEGSQRNLEGDAPNGGLEERTASVQFKQGISPYDDLYFQATYDWLNSGDAGQKYDPAVETDSNFNAKSEQLPNIFAGYHHEWSPGSHTLLTFANLRDDTTIEDIRPVNVLFPDGLKPFGVKNFAVATESEYRATVAEAQQILTLREHSLIFGGGWQGAQVENHQMLTKSAGGTPILGFLPYSSATNQFLEADLLRLKAYAYDQWHIFDTAWLTAGISYDHLELPIGTDSVPMSVRNQVKDQVSPKAGLTWLAHPSTVVKAGYSHSLAGLFFENSVRLEPTQIGGFNQAYRGLAPEAISGPVPGATLRVLDFGSDTKLPSGTYFGWQAEWLRSDGNQATGAFQLANDPTISSVVQQSEFDERSLKVYANQLLGEYFSLGFFYNIARARLDEQIPQFTSSTQSRRESTLQRYGASIRFNHSSGFFAVAEGLGYHQEIQSPDLPTETLWQFNVYAGYRFPFRRAEVLVGLVNLGDQDYRLYPLNTFERLPRHRAFLASLKVNL